MAFELEEMIRHGEYLPASAVERYASMAKQKPFDEEIRSTWIHLAQRYHDQIISRHGRFLADPGGICRKARRLLAEAEMGLSTPRKKLTEGQRMANKRRGGKVRASKPATGRMGLK